MWRFTVIVKVTFISSAGQSTELKNRSEQEAEEVLGIKIHFLLMVVMVKMRAESFKCSSQFEK